jgi:hypothetical protein
MSSAEGTFMGSGNTDALADSIGLPTTQPSSWNKDDWVIYQKGLEELYNNIPGLKETKAFSTDDIGGAVDAILDRLKSSIGGAAYADPGKAAYFFAKGDSSMATGADIEARAKNLNAGGPPPNYYYKNGLNAKIKGGLTSGFIKNNLMRNSVIRNMPVVRVSYNVNGSCYAAACNPQLTPTATANADCDSQSDQLFNKLFTEGFVAMNATGVDNQPITFNALRDKFVNSKVDDTSSFHGSGQPGNIWTKQDICGTTTNSCGVLDAQANNIINFLNGSGNADGGSSVSPQEMAIRLGRLVEQNTSAGASNTANGMLQNATRFDPANTGILAKTGVGSAISWLGEVIVGALGQFFGGVMAVAILHIVKLIADGALMGLIILTPLIFLMGLLIPGNALGMLFLTTMGVFLLKFLPVTQQVLDFTLQIFNNTISGMTTNDAIGQFSLGGILLLGEAVLYAKIISITFFLIFKLGDPNNIRGLMQIENAAEKVADVGRDVAVAAASIAATMAIGAGLAAGGEAMRAPKKLPTPKGGTDGWKDPKAIAEEYGKPAPDLGGAALARISGPITGGEIFDPYTGELLNPDITPEDMAREADGWEKFALEEEEKKRREDSLMGDIIPDSGEDEALEQAWAISTDTDAVGKPGTGKLAAENATSGTFTADGRRTTVADFQDQYGQIDQHMRDHGVGGSGSAFNEEAGTQDSIQKYQEAQAGAVAGGDVTTTGGVNATGAGGVNASGAGGVQSTGQVAGGSGAGGAQPLQGNGAAGAGPANTNANSANVTIGQADQDITKADQAIASAGGSGAGDSGGGTPPVPGSRDGAEAEGKRIEDRVWKALEAGRAAGAGKTDGEVSEHDAAWDAKSRLERAGLAAWHSLLKSGGGGLLSAIGKIPFVGNIIAESANEWTEGGIRAKAQFVAEQKGTSLRELRNAAKRREYMGRYESLFQGGMPQLELEKAGHTTTGMANIAYAAKEGAAAAMAQYQGRRDVEKEQGKITTEEIYRRAMLSSMQKPLDIKQMNFALKEGVFNVDEWKRTRVSDGKGGFIVTDMEYQGTKTGFDAVRQMQTSAALETAASSSLDMKNAYRVHTRKMWDRKEDIARAQDKLDGKMVWDMKDGVERDGDRAFIRDGKVMNAAQALLVDEHHLMKPEFRYTGTRETTTVGADGKTPITVTVPVVTPIRNSVQKAEAFIRQKVRESHERDRMVNAGGDDTFWAEYRQRIAELDFRNSDAGQKVHRMEIAEKAAKQEMMVAYANGIENFEPNFRVYALGRQNVVENAITLLNGHLATRHDPSKVQKLMAAMLQEAGRQGDTNFIINNKTTSKEELTDRNFSAISTNALKYLKSIKEDNLQEVKEEMIKHLESFRAKGKEGVETITVKDKDGKDVPIEVFVTQRAPRDVQRGSKRERDESTS